MKISDLKCALLGSNPVVRIVTDEGISGYGEIEMYRPYVVPQVLYYRDAILGADPTDVERVMLRIRNRGAFKPWGSAISAIEMALWDVAGKAAGLPVYKLLGGKVRDKVRVYNGAVRFPMEAHTPQGYARNMARMKESPEGFTIIKELRATPSMSWGRLLVTSAAWRSSNGSRNMPIFTASRSPRMVLAMDCWAWLRSCRYVLRCPPITSLSNTLSATRAGGTRS
jgi:L-alanine-DL-glutamate epimerase-like enolase superfamily enzyme